MSRITKIALAFALATGWLFSTPLLRGQEAKSAFDRGIEASSKGDLDGALASFNEAIRANPMYVSAYNNRGNVYEARGDYDKAMADYDQAIKLEPRYVSAYINRGIAWAARGNADNAMSDYDTALILDPKNVLAFINRGVLREGGGDYRKAIADFESAIENDPNSGLAYNNLAWLLATCPEAVFRDGKKAVEFANKACELAQWSDPEWVDTLAAACAEAGDFAQAVKWESKYIATPKLSKSSAAAAASRLKLYQAHQPYRTAQP